MGAHTDTEVTLMAGVGVKRKIANQNSNYSTKAGESLGSQKTAGNNDGRGGSKRLLSNSKEKVLLMW